MVVIPSTTVKKKTSANWVLNIPINKAHTRIYIHTYTHAYTHRHTNVRVDIRSQSHVCTHKHMYMQTHISTQIYACIYCYMNAHKRIHVYKTYTNQLGNIRTRAAGASETNTPIDRQALMYTAHNRTKTHNTLCYKELYTHADVCSLSFVTPLVPQKVFYTRCITLAPYKPCKPTKRYLRFVSDTDEEYAGACPRGLGSLSNSRRGPQ